MADAKSSRAGSEYRSVAPSQKSYAKQMKEVSVYSQTNSKLHEETRSRHSNSVRPNDFNAPDFRLHRNDLYGPNPNETANRPMQLVPCRWSKNGWKYVEADPGHHKFFNNPNRINSVGFSPGQKQAIARHYNPAQFEEADRFGGTSYQSFFKP